MERCALAPWRRPSILEINLPHTLENIMNLFELGALLIIRGECKSKLRVGWTHKGENRRDKLISVASFVDALIYDKVKNRPGVLVYRGQTRGNLDQNNSWIVRDLYLRLLLAYYYHTQYNYFLASLLFFLVRGEVAYLYHHIIISSTNNIYTLNIIHQRW